jgi:hypothetical protein
MQLITQGATSGHDTSTAAGHCPPPLQSRIQGNSIEGGPQATIVFISNEPPQEADEHSCTQLSPWHMPSHEPAPGPGMHALGGGRLPQSFSPPAPALAMFPPAPLAPAAPPIGGEPPPPLLLPPLPEDPPFGSKPPSRLGVTLPSALPLLLPFPLPLSVIPGESLASLWLVVLLLTGSTEYSSKPMMDRHAAANPITQKAARKEAGRRCRTNAPIG